MRFRLVGIPSAVISLTSSFAPMALAVVDTAHTESEREGMESEQSTPDAPQEAFEGAEPEATPSNGGRPVAPFSARDCVSHTRRNPSKSILQDPNDRSETHSTGIHLLAGETVCIAAELDAQGRVQRMSPIDAGKGITIALRLSWTPKGSQLQIATTSDRPLYYRAFVPISGSRLVVPTSTTPVRPSGVSYEFWPTDIDELWLAGLRFASVERPDSALPAVRRAPPPRKGPADRDWGIELGLTGGVAQGSFEDLDRYLAAEGFGHVDRSHSVLGFWVGGFWRPLRFGLFVRGTGELLASHDQLEARWLQAGPYLGFDLYRWRWLTTYVQAEYEPSEVTLKRQVRLPGFSSASSPHDQVGRSTHGLGLGIGHEFHMPVYSDTTGQMALTLGAKLGYTWQLAQRSRWHYKEDEKDLEATTERGPSLDTHGWRFELRVGTVLYAF